MIAAGVPRHPDGTARRDLHARNAGAQARGRDRKGGERQQQNRLHVSVSEVQSYARTIAGWTFRTAAIASSVSRSVYFGFIITPANRPRISMVRGQHSRP